MYVFKKVDSLLGDDNQNQTTGSQDNIIGDGGQGGYTQKGTSEANPYASTYRNPNAIYEANKTENQGNVDTGLNKNLEDTRNNLKQGNADYTKNLDTVAQGYKYNGQDDLTNINDESTWNRLNNVLNTSGGKASLQNVQSNTKYYNPDTSGVAAASTVEGLSNQLKNQYGSTAGGSRLDAQLYRGSGQAGQAINDNLKKIDDFRTEKQGYLDNEANALKNYQTQLDTNAANLKSQGADYQTNLLSQAQAKAKAQQDLYNQNRANAMGQLDAVRNGYNLNALLTQAGNEGINGRNIWATTQGLTEDQQKQPGWEYVPGATNYSDSGQTDNGYYRRDIAKDILNSMVQDNLKNIDLKSAANENYYLDPTKNINENMYLDPRYNKLGQLLSTDQRALETAPTDLNVNANTAGYQSALQDYLNPKLAEIRNQANDLFAGSRGGGTDVNDQYSTKVLTYIKSHPQAAAILAPVLGNALIGGATLDVAKGIGTPAFNKISSMF